MNHTLYVQVFASLTPVILAALSWLGGEAIKLIRTKTKSETLTMAMTRLSDIILTVTAELEQTIVRTLKEKSADGHLSNEDMVAVKQAALEKIKSYLGPNGVALTMKALGFDSHVKFDSFLNSKIESAVLQLKHDTPVTIVYPSEPLPPFLQGNPPDAKH